MTNAQTKKANPDTKIGSVIKLLRRRNGATLDQLAKATSWQKHSVRAALTGLRKKGHAITREKRGDASHYMISEAAS